MGNLSNHFSQRNNKIKSIEVSYVPIRKWKQIIM